MAVVVGLGVLLLLVSLVLALRAHAVINRVTSRPLGTLPPGFAGRLLGYTVYVGLIQAIGLTVLGLGLSAYRPSTIMLAVIGSAEFVGLTIAAIIGEITTYRALKP